MERKAAHSCHRNQRRSEFTGRSAIHICNTIRCDSVCSHSLVPVLDASDPLKRLPDSCCGGDRAHGAYRHARSAPCFAGQGHTGRETALTRIARRRTRVNVSKVKRRETARAIDGGWPRRRCCTNVTRAAAVRWRMLDADDPLTIARRWPCKHAVRTRSSSLRVLPAHLERRLVPCPMAEDADHAGPPILPSIACRAPQASRRHVSIGTRYGARPLRPVFKEWT